MIPKMVDPNNPIPIPDEPISRKIAAVLLAAPEQPHHIDDLAQAVSPDEYRIARGIVDVSSQAWSIRRVEAPIAMAVERSYLPRYVHADGFYFQTGLFSGLNGNERMYRAIPAKSADLPARQEVPAGYINWGEPVDTVDKYQVAVDAIPGRRKTAISIATILRTQLRTGYRYDELADMVHPTLVGAALREGEAGVKTLVDIHSKISRHLTGESRRAERILQADGFQLQKGTWIPDKRLQARPRAIVRAVLPGQATVETEECRSHTVHWE